jgi:hypothetical protein
MTENHVAGAQANQAEPRSSTSSHTPGPWVSAVSMTGGIAVFAGKHSNHILATARDPYGDAKCVAEANTRLISAAPDMYVALEAAWLFKADMDRSTRDLIDAAMRKARGEQ